jgi:phosphatidylglycerol:prolipoprotein diacylglycerol transferase
VLWRIGARFLQEGKPSGRVFCAYLILTGVARFLVELIRLNPRSFWGMSNAQTASVASILLGLIVVISRKPGALPVPQDNQTR